jgi:uncharacterized membrane protein YhaH (DUF805 family)
MNFQEAVKSVFIKYANFNGRSTRSEYWWFVLFNIAFYFLVFSLEEFIDGDLAVLVAFFWLGTLIPYLAVATRRLHDVGQSGAMHLIIFLPFGIIILFAYLVTKSQADNEYGPDPMIGITQEDIDSIGNN